MDDAGRIIRLTPLDALTLEERVKAGDSAAARDFVLYAAWRSIKRDRYVPEKAKAKVFHDLLRRINVEVRTSGGPGH